MLSTRFSPMTASPTRPMSHAGMMTRFRMLGFGSWNRCDAAAIVINQARTFQPSRRPRPSQNPHFVADVNRPCVSGDGTRVDCQPIKMVEARAGGPVRERLVPLLFKDRGELGITFARRGTAG